MVSWPFKSWHYFCLCEDTCLMSASSSLSAAALPCTALFQSRLLSALSNTLHSPETDIVFSFECSPYTSQSACSLKHVSWWEVSYRLSELVCSVWWAAICLIRRTGTATRYTRCPSTKSREDAQQKLLKEVKDFGWLPLSSSMSRTAPHTDLTWGTKNLLKRFCWSVKSSEHLGRDQ